MDTKTGSPLPGDTATYARVRRAASPDPNVAPAPAGVDPNMLGPEYRDDINVPDAATMYRAMEARDQRRLIISTVCASLVLITTLAFVIPMFAFGNTRTSKSSRSSQVVVRDGEVEVPLYVRATNLDGNGSRIPLRISGHRPDGSSTEDACFLSYTGEGLVLTPGTYEVRVAETPIAGDGTMYAIPEALQIEVTESFEVYFATDDTLRMDRLAAADMTDEVISSARSWIEKDPDNRDRADEFVQKAKKKREEELARERERAEAQERIATQEREVAEASEIIQEQQQNNPEGQTNNNNNNSESSEKQDESKGSGSSESKDESKDTSKEEGSSGSTEGSTSTPTEPTTTPSDPTPSEPTPEPTPAEPTPTPAEPEVTPTPTDSGTTEATTGQTTEASAPAAESTAAATA